VTDGSAGRRARGDATPPGVRVDCYGGRVHGARCARAHGGRVGRWWPLGEQFYAPHPGP